MLDTHFCRLGDSFYMQNFLSNRISDVSALPEKIQLRTFPTFQLQAYKELNHGRKKFDTHSLM